MVGDYCRFLRYLIVPCGGGGGGGEVELSSLCDFACEGDALHKQFLCGGERFAVGDGEPHAYAGKGVAEGIVGYDVVAGILRHGEAHGSDFIGAVGGPQQVHVLFGVQSAGV